MDSKSGEFDSTSETIAAHYGAIEEMSLETRSSSPIINIRNYNNWIKSVIINNYTDRIRLKMDDINRVKVLDMCCGKGGDLKKWSRADVDYYVGLDIAKTSLDSAIRRSQIINQLRRHKLRTRFIAIDCFSNLIREDLMDNHPDDPLLLLYPKGQFHIVSCMFALHYAFENEDKARSALQNVASNLIDGGYFIAIIPNESIIQKRLKASQTSKFGNSLYEIEFCENIVTPTFKTSRYKFSLLEAVNECPEFTVNTELIQSLGLEYGLVLESCEPLGSIYEKYKRHPTYSVLLLRMHLFQHQMSLEDLEVTELYDFIVFVKQPANS